MFASGYLIDRYDAVRARRTPCAGDLVGAGPALLHRLRLGAVLAAGAGAADRSRCSSTTSTCRARWRWFRKRAAQPAGDVGRAAAAADELHRHGPGSDLGRRRQRLVRRAGHDNSLQIALYTLIPVYLVAIALFVCARAKRLAQGEAR